jgi:membrane peptidoglycan carboxypeptidase
VDLPGEGKGKVWPAEQWKGYAIASISMGQEVGVTPMQLITAVSAIANGGFLLKPHIIQEIRRGERALPAEGILATGEPKQVVRPETAATLRRLMEGVVLEGTGPRARLDGWTSAGKTGSAQKIDASGRYSRTQLIASFTGFAPINNPAVAILVSLDSTGHHEGGEVAAPVFKRIGEQVLAYLDVPRDVPLNPKLIQTAYMKSGTEDDSALADFASVDFSGPADTPTEGPEPTRNDEARRPADAKSPAVTVTVDEGGDVEVPDFSGQTMREVTEACLRLGLDPLLIGSNLATNQKPAAGAKVRRGAKVTVQFGTPAEKKSKARHRNGN